MIDVLHNTLGPLVKWPTRDEVFKTMPIDFGKQFSKCIVIIDCFELFTERPTCTDLMAISQPWSNYNKHKW